MTLASGTKLGPYEITGALGGGGMGEVYRARDTRLDRTVAVKILPDHLSDRAELRERFEREARTVASLNHPHICTLFDIGQQDGTDFLVMEYLEGETLAERLKKGPLPLDQVLQYAIEISDALDKAHRKGITHRDLKPGNIMLTKSGAKLLDFGLAKLKQEATPTASLSQRPTAESAMTAEGTILGTLQYMAPEQVEGKTNDIDARTDIFGFGAVVYEMATGKKAFEGKTSASVVAKILEVDPPSMISLQPMTPAALDRIVKKCLAKDPENRWQSARDLETELKWIAEGGALAPSAQTVPKRGIRALGQRPSVLVVGALLIAIVTALGVWSLEPSLAPNQTVTRFTITLPPGQQLAGLNDGPAVALSPDGTRLAYVAVKGGTQQLYLRAMDSLEAQPILGTEGAVNPFFSPDGQWLGFFARDKLKKVAVSGGAAVTLGDAPFPCGASWGSQGIIAFAPAFNGVLEQVSDAGGTPRPLSRLEKTEGSHRWPEFLPGGTAVLFSAGVVGQNWGESQVAIQSLGTGERRNLVQGGTYPRYALSGHLIYSQRGTLLAVPFDPQRLTVTGAAVPVAEGVLQSTGIGHAQYSFSATGSLAYVPGTAQAAFQSRLVWVNRNGVEQPVAAPAHAYRRPQLSPDGRLVAVGIQEQETQVWLYDLARETLTRLTFAGNFNVNPVWTPDEKRIAFTSNKEGAQSIFWQLADGSGGLERLTTGEYNNNHVPMSWSPDGQLLAFIEVNPTTGLDIWVLRMGDRKAQPFLRTPFNEGAPRFSPDGRWLAYISDESGRFEIYVQPYPGPGGKWQISTDGGSEPLWNPNGRELFYRSGAKMMAVDIATQPSFAAGKARVLFEGQYQPSPATIPNYDVSPDGQRFLMLKSSEQTQAAPTQINVVLNWFEELKRKK
jgi:Tol biopolymer transport system component/predicted Ser/Thr protein kinase